ncbi:ester cyclase [Mycobacterium sp. URHB0044]|jgi:steroid delta-isomerase-like uncharacterized protein|uniref:ester cyclase n=1 Tax=Mycobacterium sp. URHB0044 TaxID=1380386 RepID=UPI00049046D3|nr:ester cyclase [Mycobacterium sp. URHB0044]
MSTTTDNRTRIEHAWLAAWDLGEVEALDTLLSPDYRRISGTGEGQSLAEFKASIVTTRAAFPDLKTIIDELVVDGDRAAVRWHSSGTHRHSFLGVPPTNREIIVSGATFAHFDGDRIAKEYVTWDPRALLTALGILTIGQDH